MLGLWSVLSIVVCAGLAGQAALANSLPRAGEYTPQYAPAHQGAVASESSVCSEIGIELLKQGGNAADAVSSPANIHRCASLIPLTRL
jgi:gamma-glutamyltranspeptidase/glutathione hydrolase